MSGDRYYITNQHQTYFITCTIVEWIDLFTRPIYKQIIVDSLNHCIKHKGLILNGWVLMTNHLHFAGRCEEPHRMSDFLRDFKKHTSKALANAVLTTPESRREWLMDKFAFEARRSGRAGHYKIWPHAGARVSRVHSPHASARVSRVHFRIFPMLAQACRVCIS